MLKSLEVPIFNRIEIRFEPPVSKYDSLVNKINIINIHQIATTNSNQFQNPYLSDRELMKRLKKELQSGLWNKHFVMEIEDWMHGEIPFDHVAIPQIHNFQSRDEVWMKQLFEEIIGIEDIVRFDGKSACKILLDDKLIEVANVFHRPFQGWRYLYPEKSPSDIFKDKEGNEIPSKILTELNEFGVL